MRSRESMDELLNEKEGEFCQFKEWKSKGDLKEASKICCAIANCGGGKLVLGVSDKRPRKVVGSTAFPQPERTRVDLMGKLRIRIDFHTYNHDNGRVLVFDVASRPIGLPVQADGGAWWYHGDSLILMPEDVRRAIYAESGHDFSGDICPGATMDDLDPDAIEKFRRIWIDNRDNKRIVSLSQEQLLRDSDAITDDGVTYAALILFGKRASTVKYLPHAEIVFEYRAKESAGPAAQRVDFRNGFFNAFDRVWELINLRNDQQHYQKRFQVLPVYTFNERVVREAILNAVSHRDYQLGGSIFVRQYNRRLVIENPGGFPKGITVENILNRQSARNTRIAEIFHLCGLVERSGQGMNLIYELAVKEAKPLPDFSGSDDYFVKLTIGGEVYDSHMLALIKQTDENLLEAMTTEDYILLSAFFHRKRYAELHKSRFEHLAELGLVNITDRGIELMNNGTTLLLDENDVHIIENSATSSIDTQSTVHQRPIDGQSKEERLGSDWGVIEERLGSDWGVIEINDRKRQIIDFFMANEKATSSQLAEHTGLTQGRVRKILKVLVADGLIEKVGDYRYASYMLKEKN